MDMKEILSIARERSLLFKSAACFDDLVKAGRVVERALPDGSRIPVVESYLSGCRRGFDPESRLVTVIASDGQTNRYGDVDDPDGWKYAHFSDYPAPVLIDHWYSMDGLVGQVTRFWRDADLSMEEHRIDPPESSERTASLLAKLAAGSANTVSRSFMPLKVDKMLDEKGEWRGQFIFREMEMLETSWVVVPAVRNAHRLNLDARPEAPPADDAARVAARSERLVQMERTITLAGIDARL